MEAPKKLYVHVKKDKVTNTWNDEWIGVHDIEYTRTDSFIEKACDWLENHNDYIDVKDGNVTYFDMRKCVEDFSKYMRGGEE